MRERGRARRQPAGGGTPTHFPASQPLAEPVDDYSWTVARLRLEPRSPGEEVPTTRYKATQPTGPRRRASDVTEEQAGSFVLPGEEERPSSQARERLSSTASAPSGRRSAQARLRLGPRAPRQTHRLSGRGSFHEQLDDAITDLTHPLRVRARRRPTAQKVSNTSRNSSAYRSTCPLQRSRRGALFGSLHDAALRRLTALPRRASPVGVSAAHRSSSHRRRRRPRSRPPSGPRPSTCTDSPQASRSSSRQRTSHPHRAIDRPVRIDLKRPRPPARGSGSIGSWKPLGTIRARRPRCARGARARGRPNRSRRSRASSATTSSSRTLSGGLARDRLRVAAAFARISPLIDLLVDLGSRSGSRSRPGVLLGHGPHQGPRRGCARPCRKAGPRPIAAKVSGHERQAGPHSLAARASTPWQKQGEPHHRDRDEAARLAAFSTQSGRRRPAGRATQSRSPAAIKPPRPAAASCPRTRWALDRGPEGLEGSASSSARATPTRGSPRTT